MDHMIDHPRLLALLCLLVMWLMALLGLWMGRKNASGADDKEHLGVVVSATLTLLGLIISFTFSMAATRYDQRRLYEENEANAIGTEYVRADLLPIDQSSPVKQLLITYLDWRISYYRSDYGKHLTTADARTADLQTQLWHSIQRRAGTDPNPVTALVVAGMNDVLNSQGYTQFSWWNRIPISAWGLMIAIAIFSNLLVGFSARSSRPGKLLLVLPLIVSFSFFLIADIDSPRGGIIRIQPVDLVSLSQQLHSTAP